MKNELGGFDMDVNKLKNLDKEELEETLDQYYEAIPKLKDGATAEELAEYINKYFDKLIMK